MPLWPSPTFPNLGHAVLLVIGTLLLQVAASGLIAAGWLATGSPSPLLAVLLNPWALAAVNISTIGAALAYGRRATGATPAEFYALRRFPVSLLPALGLTAVGLATVLSEMDNIMMEVLRLIPGFKSDDTMMQLMTGDALGSFLLLVVVAPLTEEFMFRGLILRGLAQHHRRVVAVILTAGLFSLMHANPRQLVLAFVIGSVFGWWTLRTRSLGPAMIGHAVFNSVAYFAIQFPEVFRTLGFAGEGNLHQPWWLTTGGLATAVLGAWWFHCRATATIPPTPEPAAPAAEPPLLSPEPPPVSASPANASPP